MHKAGLYSVEKIEPHNEARITARWRLGQVLSCMERGTPKLRGRTTILGHSSAPTSARSGWTRTGLRRRSGLVRFPRPNSKRRLRKRATPRCSRRSASLRAHRRLSEAVLTPRRLVAVNLCPRAAVPPRVQRRDVRGNTCLTVSLEDHEAPKHCPPSHLPPRAGLFWSITSCASPPPQDRAEARPSFRSVCPTPVREFVRRQKPDAAVVVIQKGHHRLGSLGGGLAADPHERTVAS